MPGPASMLAPAGKRVVVEKVLAVERQAAKRAVVERELQHVGVPPVALDQQHAMRPEDEPDRGTRFGVGRIVRQIIVRGEAFVARRGPDAAGDIQALHREVRPQRFAGRHQARVVVLAGKVRHRAIEIHRAHRMADDVALFAHGQVRLAVLVGSVVLRCRILAARDRLPVEVVRLTAALIDEKARKLEITALVREVIELHQGELDLRMAAVAAPLVRARAEIRSQCSLRSASPHR